MKRQQLEDNQTICYRFLDKCEFARQLLLVALCCAVNDVDDDKGQDSQIDIHTW